MSKGGVYGSFVMIEFKDGTSKEFPLKAEAANATDAIKYKKSPLAYVKAPIAEFFGWEQVTKKDMLKHMVKKVNTTINGKPQTIEKMVPMGATGASRSITVRFTKLVKIGGKDVASVKIAMPTSYTFSNMVQKVMESNKGAQDVAAIVSPAGKSITFKTPYKNGGAGKPKLKNK